MKVCDIVQFHSSLSGGVKQYVNNKGKFLSRQPDVDHVVVVPSHSDGCEEGTGPKTYRIRSPRLIGSRSYRVLLSRKRILKILREEKPDLIEVGDPYLSAWIASDFALESGTPIVAYYHSDYPRALDRTISRFGGRPGSLLFSRVVPPYLRRLYSRMDTTVVATHRLIGILDRLGIPNLTRIPLGADIEAFVPSGDREMVLQELGIPPGRRVLLFIGRLAREKNIRQLLSMLDCFDPEESFTLVLLGGGELEGLVRRAQALKPNLVWLPYCESTQWLARVYSAADLFVHPGTVETFGLVSLEAQACGTRVLAVRGGGLEESLFPEPRPVLAESAEPQALADAVREVFQPGDESPETAIARRRWVVEGYSWDITFSRLEGLYRELIERRRRSASSGP